MKINITMILFAVEHIFFIGLIILLLIINTELKNYNANVTVCEYTDDSFAGIRIPDELDVYFLSGVDDIYLPGVESIFDTAGTRTVGIYIKSQGKIEILYDRDIYDVQSTLIHELAHHRYYNLSDSSKDKIETIYGYFCENEKEFYAHTIQNYGTFQWIGE